MIKKNLYNKWVVGIIITIGATGIFFGLKALNVVIPPKTSKLDAMDVMTLAGGICGGVLVKDYAVYKKWVNEWMQQKLYCPLKGNKISTNTIHVYPVLLFNG